LPGTDIDGAIHLAERIRAALADRVVVAPTGEHLRCTASFGVAEWEGSTEAAQLLAGADAALYHAKGRGKNRVEAAGNVSVEASGVSA
jgi:diguanylate cyclase (GGDEF)-like protein